jgi:hypothetical protein
MTLLHHQAMVSENDQLSQIRIEVQTVFGHFRFFLYISYKTTVLKKYYLEVNSCPISIIILSVKAERYVVYIFQTITLKSIHVRF